MSHHGRGHASDAPARLLRQHLFHCKLSDIDVTLEICFGESLKIVRGIVSERLSEKMPALLTTPSIEPNLLIAVAAISAAVEASPMFPSTIASLSVGSTADFVIWRELATTL
jgi:hypothetical protein